LRIRVSSLGFAVPAKIETAAQLAPRIGRSEDWIVAHTGVRERRIATTETMEELAATAAREALGDERPDLIINASTTPRQLIPDSSVFIQRALGFHGIPSYSVHATCLSFVAGLQLAGGLLVSKQFDRILLVSSETGSISRNFDEPESAALIGDGAAAAVVERTPEGESSQLLAWQMGTWPEGAELTEFRGAGTFRHPNDARTVSADNLFKMDGPRVYKMARRKVAEVLVRLLEQANMDRSQIDVVVPHQASGPALEALARYGFDEARIVNIVARYGNCIAASLPMALVEADRTGLLRRGKTVMLLGTGAGLSVAGAILRW
jgi:3-oxoacyl-[acyl-carrier-protein] synthase III